MSWRPHSRLMTSLTATPGDQLPTLLNMLVLERGYQFYHTNTTGLKYPYNENSGSVGCALLTASVLYSKSRKAPYQLSAIKRNTRFLFGGPRQWSNGLRHLSSADDNYGITLRFHTKHHLHLSRNRGMHIYHVA